MPLAVACAACGTQPEPGERFCGQCGAPLEKDAAPSSATPAPSVQPAVTPGTSFSEGRYQVKSFLGEGGRKRVYLAHDSRLDRDVAIAVIKTEGLDEAGRSRVRREAQAMGRRATTPTLSRCSTLVRRAESPTSSPSTCRAATLKRASRKLPTASLL